MILYNKFPRLSSTTNSHLRRAKRAIIPDLSLVPESGKGSGTAALSESGIRLRLGIVALWPGLWKLRESDLEC